MQIRYKSICYSSLRFLFAVLFHLFFFIWVSDFILRKFFRTAGDQLYFSKVELGNYITEQMSSVEDNER
jgi:hypothetical protein